MINKNVLLLTVGIVCAGSFIPSQAKMTYKSMFKVAGGALVGSIPGIIAFEQIEKLRTNGWLCAAAAALAGYVTYKCGHLTYKKFTPEGIISCAKNCTESFNPELLDRISNVSTFEQYHQRVVTVNATSAFPTIIELELLSKNRCILVSQINALKAILSKVNDSPDLYQEATSLVEKLEVILAKIDNAIILLKSDFDYEKKWTAYQGYLKIYSETNLNNDLGFWCYWNGVSDIISSIINIVRIFEPCRVNIYHH